MAGQPKQPDPLEQIPGVQPQAAPVPDHRIDDMMKRFRTMEQENAQLRGQIDMLSRGPQQQAQKTESPFEPKVEEALNGLIASKFGEFKTAGFLYDKTDELNFNHKYGSERFQKFHEKVEDIRKERQRQGTWVSREEALRIAHFEQTGRKPHPDKQEAQPVTNAPVYDPYLQTWIDPQSQKPVDPPQINAQGQPQAPQVPQAQAQPAPFNPQSQVQQVPQQEFAPREHQQGVPAEVPFQLPNQAVTPQGVPPQQTQHQQIDVDSSSEDLAAWAETYGDVNL
jgi:hypothetical protein